MRAMTRAVRALIGAPVVILGLVGCGTFDPKVDVVEPVSARPVVPVYTPPSNGAIFQSTAYRPLYETHRARLVGDIITVTITESISAKQELSSSLSKAGTVNSSITGVPLFNVSQVAKLGAAGSSNNTFDGKGATASTNTFTGTITATVIEVLPNGHLLIAGEKQIGVNQNVDVLRFSGQIDPINIQPGNVVASSTIANVRVDQRGRGAQNAAQGIGWLARFFLSLSPL